MGYYINAEISAEAVADAMANSAGFAAEVWMVFADRIHKGVMKDDAADLCAGMTEESAAFVVNAFRDLSSAMRDGFNMSHVDQQI